MIWYITEANAVRWFKLKCLAYSFFLIIIIRKLLPLSVDRMHWSSWENSLFKNTTPVCWIFGSSRRIVWNNVKNFHYLSYRKLSSRKGYWLKRLFDTLFDIFRCWEYFLRCYTLHYPVTWENESFVIVLRYFFFVCSHLCFTEQATLFLRKNLVRAAFNYINDNSSILFNQLTCIACLRAVRNEKHHWYSSYEWNLLCK